MEKGGGLKPLRSAAASYRYYTSIQMFLVVIQNNYMYNLLKFFILYSSFYTYNLLFLLFLSYLQV